MSKTLLKSLYYLLNPARFPSGVSLELGYVFHTEMIHEPRTFERLLAFLRDYRAVTGKRAICTIMTPENARVRAAMMRSGCDDSAYAERVHRIGELASLGYHGHYFVSPRDFGLPEAEIRCNNFVAAPVREQLEAELGWFRRHGLSHQGHYSAGWWFMNAYVQGLLIEKGFEYDFSISSSPWFRNQYSYRLMTGHSIATGRPFRVRAEGGSLTCVQNLIGCHTTPFPGDYVRNVRKLLTPGWNDCVAVHHSHDYDLDPANTLKCLRALGSMSNVSFFGAEEIPGILSRRELPELELSTLGPRLAAPIDDAVEAGTEA